MTIARTLEQWSLWSLLKRIFSAKSVEESQEAEFAKKIEEFGWSKELQDTLADLIAKTIKSAREIDAAGELRIVGREKHIGFISVQVCLQIDGVDTGSWWQVDIFPTHIITYGRPLDLWTITHIKFGFSEHPLRNRLNFSSYLTIKNVR